MKKVDGQKNGYMSMKKVDEHLKKKKEKKKEVACCMSVHDTKKKKVTSPSMNKSGRTPKKKKKKFEDKVTLSHVGKSTTQSRWTKYLKNGTLIEDYNAS